MIARKKFTLFRLFTYISPASQYFVSGRKIRSGGHTKTKCIKHNATYSRVYYYEVQETCTGNVFEVGIMREKIILEKMVSAGST